MRYYFEWDPNKAKANRKKHGIGFEQASTIFLDPRMIAVFDSEHSEHEARWATIGIDRNGILLVVVHTFQQLDADCCRIKGGKGDATLSLTFFNLGNTYNNIMPRIARAVVEGIPYHVTQRGNRREDIFFEDEDRKK